MDVHPPLAKLLLTLAGWLAGFDGEFDFKDIGKDYLEPGVPYVAMRMFPALCGVLLAPTIFLTLKAAGCRTTTAAMGACLIVFGEDFLRSPSLRCFLTEYRKRSPDASTTDSSRFTSHDHDRIYGIGLHIFHKPTRTGTFTRISAKLVALACADGPWFRSNSQCQVGWSFHNCLGWHLDGCAIVGSSWRRQDSHSSKFALPQRRA